MQDSRDGRIVMLVEDDAAVRGALARFLDLHGFGVACASTADEAFAVLRTRRLAAAVVDLQLSEGSGRDVVVQVPQPIPVIIFSGAPGQSGQLERLRPRTRLICKPYSLLLVIDTLRSLLEPKAGL